MKDKILDITRGAIVIALYVVITIWNPLSYETIQFRISEALVLLCFYNKKYSLPLLLACFIANLFSPYFLFDLFFGTLATGIAVFFISKSKNIFIASLYPVIWNGILVALEIMIMDKIPFNAVNFFSISGFIALGEFIVVSVLGGILFKAIEKNLYLMNILDLKRKNLKEDL